MIKDGFCNVCNCGGARGVLMYSVIMGAAITFQLVSKPGTCNNIGNKFCFEIVEI